MTIKSPAASSEMPYVRSTFGCGCGEVIDNSASSPPVPPTSFLGTVLDLTTTGISPLGLRHNAEDAELSPKSDAHSMADHGIFIDTGRTTSSTSLKGGSGRAFDAAIGVVSLEVDAAPKAVVGMVSIGNEFELDEADPTDDAAILLTLLLDTEDVDDTVADDWADPVCGIIDTQSSADVVADSNVLCRSCRNGSAC